MVGGKVRLLVACQNRHVYIFEVGPGPLDSAPAGLPCHSLRDNLHKDSPQSDESEMYEHEQQRVVRCSEPAIKAMSCVITWHKVAQNSTTQHNTAHHSKPCHERQCDVVQ